MRLIVIFLIAHASLCYGDCQQRLDRAKGWRLTRDGMPEIFEREQSFVEIKKANSKQYKNLLLKKLEEEIAEFSQEPSLEELADVKEVVLAIIRHFQLNVSDQAELTQILDDNLRHFGFDEADLERARLKKRALKGGFDQGFMIRALPGRRKN